MNFADEYLETFEQVLTNPTGYFESEQRRDGFSYPLKVAFTSLVLMALLASVRTLIFGNTFMGPDLAFQGSLLMAAFGVLIFTPLVGLAGIFIASALVHILVVILGGEEGFPRTLAVLEYASILGVLSSLAAFVPLLGGLIGFLIFLYGIFVEVRGIENFQYLTTGRAALAVLLPGAVLFVIVTLVAVIAGLAGLGLSMI